MHVDEFAEAAAKYYLLRPDLFGGANNAHWHMAQPVLSHFLDSIPAAAATCCAVPSKLLGDGWPPAPNVQLHGFMHKSWAEAKVHVAAARGGSGELGCSCQVPDNKAQSGYFQLVIV